MLYVHQGGHRRAMSKNPQTAERPITSNSPVYPDDLEAAIQETLLTLADVDRAYELRREAIKNSFFTLVEKKRLRAEVETLHRKEREPYALRLAELHYRMVRASLFKTIH